MKKRCQQRQALALLAASLSGFALAAPTFPEQEKVCTFNAVREAARALSAANFPTPFASEMLVNGVSVCCLLYTSPSPRDRTRSRMPSSA